MIDVTALAIPEVKLVSPRVHRDERGFFLERFVRSAYVDAGIANDFLQDNHSRSVSGTVRGLHFQQPPFAQAKLVGVARGTILDVAVDLRLGSPTYGRWVSAVLDDERFQQLYVPVGFAHGFAVHSDVADVLYKVDAPYAPEAERGIRWDDPDLGIEWGVLDAIVSTKDRSLPPLANVDTGFKRGAGNGGPNG